MKARILVAALALAPAAAPAQEIVLWGIQVEQLEYRFGGEEEAIAWDADAFVGSDELKNQLRNPVTSSSRTSVSTMRTTSRPGSV